MSSIGERCLAEVSLAGGYSALRLRLLVLGHGALRLDDSLQPCRVLVQNEIIDALIVLKSTPVLLVVRRQLGLKLLPEGLAMQERRRERRLQWAGPHALRSLIYPFFAAVLAQDHFRLSFEARIDVTGQRRWLGECRREESA